jgi:cobalt-zinc-cadmium efflux system outer membrane protein
MRARAWCVALVLGFISAPAAAQILVSEADALARLSPESPRVRVIRAPLDLARAEVLVASRWPNPRVTFDRESVAGVTEGLTMVAQALPITGRRSFEKSAATRLLAAMTSRTDDEVRRARADLRVVFADLQAAQTRERELARARDRLQEVADILGRREAEGDAPGFDRLRAEREVLDIEADLAIAATDRARAQANLASFFAAAIDPSTLVAADAPIARPSVPAVDALVERAETARGELVAFQHELEAARLALRAADKRLIPEPEIIVGTKSSSLRGGTVGSVLSVQAVIPLFDRARPERALAQARAAQAEARAAAFRIALRSQVAALRTVALERRAAADRYRATALSGASEIERIAQVSYEAGERGILELLDAYRIGTAARVRQATLDAGARQAEVELEFVSGWEIP